jgi:hypothetical protein
MISEQFLWRKNGENRKKTGRKQEENRKKTGKRERNRKNGLFLFPAAAVTRIIIFLPTHFENVTSLSQGAPDFLG